MRIAAWAVMWSAACYSPTPNSGAPCDPAAPNCPTGQACVPSGGGHVCSSGDGNGEPDAPVGPEVCVGTGLIKSLCVSPRQGALTIDNTRTIDTATDCMSIALQPGGPSLCVHAYENILVRANAVVSVTGPNVLVLVATDLMEISGIVDVSGHRGGPPGPGARTSCGALDGTKGDLNSGAGGAAGGGYVGAGGNGGRGGIGANGGTGAAAPQTVAIGGCAGGRGGNGGGGAGGGAGGPGGGVFYAISNGVITVDGIVAAAGGGGAGNDQDLESGGGGGGGGAGGLIAFDAPSVIVSGALVANGGGGGGGGGNDIDLRGGPGGETEDPLTAAAGGSAGSGGGGGAVRDPCSEPRRARAARSRSARCAAAVVAAAARARSACSPLHRYSPAGSHPLRRNRILADKPA